MEAVVEIEPTVAVADVVLPGLQVKVETQGRNKMPCDYKEYPKNWPEIRQAILARAENKCELCGAENGKPHWKTGSKVILTIAHLDQDIKNNKRWNLLATCQRCHLKIDLPYKIKRRKERRMVTEDVEVSVNDSLIKGLGEKIAKGIDDYIKENHLEKSKIEIHVTTIQSDNPREIKVVTTIKEGTGTHRRRKE